MPAEWEFVAKRNEKSSTNSKPEKWDNGEVKPQQNANKWKSKTRNEQGSKQKQYKSIELALKNIRPDEFKSIYFNAKAVYPAMPVVWLHDLANCLNVHLSGNVQDAAFTGKANDYPLCALPTALRNILESVVCHAGPDTAARFFELCLTSMANDMNKNCSGLGYKICVQHLVRSYPDFSLRDVAKYTALRNSYENQPNIGISILWALGQAGFVAWQFGYAVFNTYMVIMVDKKHYTNFVVKYLTRLIHKHEHSFHLELDEYEFLMNFVDAKKKYVSREIANELLRILPICNARLMVEIPETCFERLLALVEHATSKPLKRNIIMMLVKLLKGNAKCFDAWHKVYDRNVQATEMLLAYIDHHWKSTREDIDVCELNRVLHRFTLDANNRKHSDDFDDCLSVIEKLSSKMSGKKQKGRSRYRFVVYTLCMFLAAFIYIDVRQNGGWNNSRTNQALNNSGVYDYTNQAYNRASECTQWVHHHIEDTFPGITQTTIQYTSPYIELGRDLGLIISKVACNAKEGIQAQIPRVIKTIDSYAPGFIETTQEIAVKVCSTSMSYLQHGKDYLMTNVLVGRLAPEEMQKTVQFAVETSVQKIHEASSWMYGKAMTFIK